MTGYGKRPYVYNHSITQPRRGRPPTTADTGVQGISDEQRWLLNIMLALPERWFVAGDFEGDDPHRYTKLARMHRRGLLARRERGPGKYEYRALPDSAPGAAPPASG